MFIAIVTVSLSIPDSHSLKDKREVLKSVKDRARNLFNVSVAGGARQDAWQYAELALATVAADQATVEQRLAAFDRFLRADPRYVLLNVQTDWL
jgi:uncharacterized protein